MLMPLEGRRVAVSMSLNPDYGEKPGLAFYPDGEVRWVRWINNERVLLSLAIQYPRYGTPGCRDSHDCDEPRRLENESHVEAAGEAQVLSASNPRSETVSSAFCPHDKRHFLVAMDDSKPNFPDVLIVDAKTGGFDRLIRARFPHQEMACRP